MEHTSAKKVIINGDDFGYSEGVNAGILKAYEQGILTSTTVISNLIADDFSLNLPHSTLSKPKLGIGVHLNITSGKPLTSTWPQAQFNRPMKGTGKPEEWMGSAWREFMSQFTEEQFFNEYDAQVQRALTIFGKIDHLDSHISNASYPPADNAYFKIAQKYNIAVRPLAQLSENPKYGGDFHIDPAFYNQAQAMHVRTVDSADLRYQTREQFYEALEQIKPGKVVEFMFHPALDDSQGAWRLADFELITSDETIEKIKSLGIELVTYADLQ